MTNRERVQKALEEAKKTATVKSKKIAPKPDTPKPLAKGEKPTKRQRSTASREARMATRGRLPLTSQFVTVMLETCWEGALRVPVDYDGEVAVKEFIHRAPGVFQLLEELDCQYWEWVAAQKAGAK